MICESKKIRHVRKGRICGRDVAHSDLNGTFHIGKGRIYMRDMAHRDVNGNLKWTDFDTHVTWRQGHLYTRHSKNKTRLETYEAEIMFRIDLWTLWRDLYTCEREKYIYTHTKGERHETRRDTRGLDLNKKSFFLIHVYYTGIKDTKIRKRDVYICTRSYTHSSQKKMQKSVRRTCDRSKSPGIETYTYVKETDTCVKEAC